jgi:hypothetical protein
MKRAWMGAIVVCVAAGLLAAVARAEDESPVGGGVVGERSVADSTMDDAALYGDAYEEDVDDWADYAAEDYDYDAAEDVSYDGGTNRGEQGWGMTSEWLEGCFAALGDRVLALIGRLEPQFGGASVASIGPAASAALFPVLLPLVEADWVRAPENAALAADGPVDPYDASLEPLTDVSDDVWSEDGIMASLAADGEGVSADEPQPPAWSDAFHGAAGPFWGNRAAEVGLPRELEPLR